MDVPSEKYPKTREGEYKQQSKLKRIRYDPFFALLNRLLKLVERRRSAISGYNGIAIVESLTSCLDKPTLFESHSSPS